MSEPKPRPELPRFLRELERIDFVRKPARTSKQLRQGRVIFDVNSLDDLFDKAKRRGLLTGSSKPVSSSGS